MGIINGKEYEVEIERIDDFTPLTKVQTVSDAPVEVSVSKPAAPASEPKKETVKESAPEPATSNACCRYDLRTSHSHSKE